jgi:hypothetical protein
MWVASKAIIIDTISLAVIKQLAAVVMVKGLDGTKSMSKKYLLLDIFLCSKAGWTAYIKQKIYLIDKLDANLLIGVDIQVMEVIITDPQNSSITIQSCYNMEIPVSMHTQSN